MIRFLVRESMAAEGVQADAEASKPREFSAKDRHEHATGVVVLCLSGPPEIWRRTIEETRRTLPGGRVVAVTFGSESPGDSPSTTDSRLGADTQVAAPAKPSELRDAILKARFERPPEPAQG